MCFCCRNQKQNKKTILLTTLGINLVEKCSTHLASSIEANANPYFMLSSPSYFILLLIKYIQT